MSWFQNLFGFPEQTGDVIAMAETKKKFEYDKGTGKLKALAVGGKEFDAGWFETPTLDDLRRDVSLDDARKLCPGRVMFREVVADVSHVHIDPKNKLALFQAASQFNCLEFPSQSGRPENGITCYSGDRTQGPACAIACAPGTIVRNYFGMEDGDMQTARKQIECLKESEQVLDNAKECYFTVRAGYTESTSEQLSRLNKKLEDKEAREKFKSGMRIGFQWKTQVTGSEFGRQQYTGPLQLVSQAYCSACSLAYSSGSKSSWEPLATAVLESLYEATMYGAVKNLLEHEGAEGSRKVFLTAVGGGVFGNEISWISRAMENAFQKVDGIGLEVILVSYGRPAEGFESLKENYPEAYLANDPRLLSALTLKGAKLKALEIGCRENDVESVDNSNDPKQAVIELILRKVFRPFARGDIVDVYSATQKAWVQDGTVLENNAGTLTVQYPDSDNDGFISESVAPDQIPHFVRKVVWARNKDGYLEVMLKDDNGDDVEKKVNGERMQALDVQDPATKVLIDGRELWAKTHNLEAKPPLTSVDATDARNMPVVDGKKEKTFATGLSNIPDKI